MENLKINYEEKKEAEMTIEIPCYLTDGKNKYAKIVDETRAVIVNLDRMYCSVSDVWTAKDVLSQSINQTSNQDVFINAYEEAFERFKKI